MIIENASGQVIRNLLATAAKFVAQGTIAGVWMRPQILRSWCSCLIPRS